MLKCDGISQVALIELESDVEFSDNIRPICLPTFASRDYNLAGHALLTAGWGENINLFYTMLDNSQKIFLTVSYFPISWNFEEF